MTKSGLAIELSKLRTFTDAKTNLEQYPTDSEIAAEVLWNAYMAKDIQGKRIADLGCGTGILGIGAMILGAAEVFFIDTDKEAIDVAIDNLKQAEAALKILGAAVFLAEDVAEFSEKVDTVITNPPFGTKAKGADVLFLSKAFKSANTVYSFHKAETEEYLRKFIEKSDFQVSNQWQFRFPLKMSMKQHRKPVKAINVICFRLAAKQKPF